MNSNLKQSTDAPASELVNGRSQMVFVAVGVSIIVGGLWMLYNADGPYHPSEQEADTHIQLSNDS